MTRTPSSRENLYAGPGAPGGTPAGLFRPTHGNAMKMPFPATGKRNGGRTLLLGGLFLAGLGPAATAGCWSPEPSAQEPSPDFQTAVESVVRERAGRTRDLLVQAFLWKGLANEAARTPGGVWEAPGMKALREELVRLVEPWVVLPPGVTWEEGPGKKALDTILLAGFELSGGLASYQVHGVGPDAKVSPGAVGVVLEVVDTLQKRTTTYELHLKKIGKTWKVVGVAVSIAPNEPPPPKPSGPGRGLPGRRPPGSTRCCTSTPGPSRRISPWSRIRPAREPGSP